MHEITALLPSEVVRTIPKAAIFSAKIASAHPIGSLFWLPSLPGPQRAGANWHDGKLRWRFELLASGTFPESHRLTDYISPAKQGII
ncbi:hypothetical protein PpBr36_07143 [Pyricularia pennisetigena]|uniref:hypothetical protein n=1 Tax=Pyricularia pennisetigena TaxID=1578925 RepID=UPI0011513B54|nr:hypothetical protein PpBr36_07143 [Pyricularia pennisetigena]TLS25508.1 hypothetical protein PpBr36_07143 [Pyricularia pennisetigena]